MNRDYEIIDQKAAYDGYFRITELTLRHALFAGGQTPTIVRECFERGHAVGVLPYDPWEDQVVLVEQFRVGSLRAGFSPWVIETVAGIIEPGETPEAVAHRESQEEAGCRLGELVPISHYLVSPGGTSETVHLYCAAIDSRDLRVDGHGLADDAEDIRLHVLPADEAIALIETGGVEAAMPIIALQWLALNRERLQARWQDGPRAPYNGPA